MSWRYLARRATTREWLHWDLPLRTDGPSWSLSAAGALAGSIEPEIGGLVAADGKRVLDEWGTLIYAEHDGVIRWGGIVTQCSWDGQAWQVEADGFSAYPHSRIYRGEYVRSQVDPAVVIDHIWQWLQGFPDGNLGVRVVGDRTPVLLGELARVENGQQVEADPYELVWWEATNCGSEINDLAATAPLDWVERCSWANASKDEVSHEIVIGYPRLGRKRDDLAFEVGSNISDIAAIQANGDEYANVIIGLGAGEGRAVLMREHPQRDGRLLREHVYSDKSVTSQARLDALIAREAVSRAAGIRITGLTVMDHPNAPVGSWSLGDDLLVRGRVPWLGDIEEWVRVTAWSLTADGAQLTVAPSDTFRYGGI